MSTLNKLGKSIIFSAPSGAGKTTLVHYLLEQLPQLEFSISACSRAPRTNEVDGKDYYFIGVEGFKKKVEEDAFLEWEEVYTDNFYGTLKSELERIWAKGHCVIFDVDVIGGLNLKKILGDSALAVFVQPPSVEVLKERLKSRSTETEEKINMRISKAEYELSFSNQFDQIILNEHLETACNEALKIVTDFIKQ